MKRQKYKAIIIRLPSKYTPKPVNPFNKNLSIFVWKLISQYALMKEKELYIDYKPQQSIYYVEKEDDSYGPVLSGSYLSKHYLDDYYEKVSRLEKSLRGQLAKGEISPIYYFKMLQEFGEKDLASRAGVSRRILKKHFTMKGFEKLTLSRIRRYADAFDIPVAFMFQLLIGKNDDVNKVRIEQIRTGNPYFIISKLESEK